MTFSGGELSALRDVLGSGGALDVTQVFPGVAQAIDFKKIGRRGLDFAHISPVCLARSRARK